MTEDLSCDYYVNEEGWKCGQNTIISSGRLKSESSSITLIWKHLKSNLGLIHERECLCSMINESTSCDVKDNKPISNTHVHNSLSSGIPIYQCQSCGQRSELQQGVFLSSILETKFKKPIPNSNHFCPNSNIVCPSAESIESVCDLNNIRYSDGMECYKQREEVNNKAGYSSQISCFNQDVLIQLDNSCERGERKMSRTNLKIKECDISNKRSLCCGSNVPLASSTQNSSHSNSLKLKVENEDYFKIQKVVTKSSTTLSEKQTLKPTIPHSSHRGISSKMVFLWIMLILCQCSTAAVIEKRDIRKDNTFSSDYYLPNWWDIYFSRFGFDNYDPLGSSLASSLSRIPDVDNCLFEEPCSSNATCVSDDNGGYSCICEQGWSGANCETDVDECVSSPCEEGPCFNTLGSFRCSCPMGWTGPNCEQDENECLSLPCKHGSCNNTIGSYRCSCSDGWTGQNCHVDVDECEHFSCPNNGTCINTEGSYKCRCEGGWTGAECLEDVDECLLKPCDHGTCENNVGSYACTCLEGWKGQNCEIDVDECEHFSCPNNGTCINTEGSYKCRCEGGWTGAECLEDVDECLLKPCDHGTCENNVGSYACTCLEGWKGQNCEIDADECETSPCHHNGTCDNTVGSYKCNCGAGWTGVNCLEDADECLLAPCNHGTCNNVVGSYTCTCLEGWRGHNCDIDSDECETSPCSHNGTCVNTVGSYTCNCSESWTGITCLEDVDECLMSPCTHGTCNNAIGSYTCSCSEGWTGHNCETDKNECTESPCQNGEACRNIPGSFVCECSPGWTGKRCNNDINECLSSPCNNSGECTNTVGSYSCSCSSAWTGQNCHLDIDECKQSPCHNGKACTNIPGSFICECSAGWTGKQCEIDIDECLSEPCHNSGICSNTVGSYDCSCTSGWSGQKCEIDADECETFPCHHNGTCVNEVGSYTCACGAGWTGTTCLDDVDECLSTPCDHGTCNNTLGSYICTCLEGWMGYNCEKDYDECLDLPCGERGLCQNTQGSYQCSCSAAWSGKDCKNDVDECESGICQNSGVCSNSIGSYTCNCTSGWSGRDCEQDENECLRLPCGNSGICENTFGSFTCNCSIGWTGKVCETDIDECMTQPCLNSGTCTNTHGSFYCSCIKGWTGKNCQLDVDECLEQPCGETGICINKEGSYICKCADGWTGKHCQTDVNECLQNPCQNGGLCTNTIGTYECSCFDPWVGTNCQSGIFINNVTDYIGAEGSTINCTVYNFNNWKTIGIVHDQDEVVSVTPDGVITNQLEPDGVTVTYQVNADYKEFILTISKLQCKHEGRYSCIVNNKYQQNSNLVVKNPATGTPKLSEIKTLFGESRTTVTCRGSPSYPDGDLIFQVKLSNETVFKEFQIPYADVVNNDVNCLRNQTVNIPFYFTKEWNEAKIRCKPVSSNIFDETTLYVLSADICAKKAVFQNLTHPYNISKYISCTRGIPEAWSCLGSECYDTNIRRCAATCDQEVVPCEENPCNNNGTCFNRRGSKYCVCSEGWTSDLCNLDINECDNNPCLHDGTCVNEKGTYSCNCEPGWQGKNCQQDEDECLSRPCRNSGTCSNTIGSYKCSCSKGWTGSRCDIDIDECVVNPCQNGGVCRNMPGSYNCSCNVAWTGQNCETDVNECLDSPCVNGGTCRNNIGSYSCLCPAPWVGLNCESGLFLTGVTERMKTKNVIGARCHIRNFQGWKRLEIKRRGRSVIRLTSENKVASRFNKKFVSVHHNVTNNYAEIKIELANLRCRDKGTYQCMVDGNHIEQANITVTTPPVGKPKISEIEELFGENNKVFNCTGNPGFPYGKFEFQVKFFNDTEFQDIQFHSAKLSNIDRNCIRTQTVNVSFLFSMEWNKAKIRCKAEDSEEYDETNVYLLSPDICDTVPVNKAIQHPYNPNKYITCTRESPKVRFCPSSTCFEDALQQCTFSCT